MVAVPVVIFPPRDLSPPHPLSSPPTLTFFFLPFPSSTISFFQSDLGQRERNVIVHIFFYVIIHIPGPKLLMGDPDPDLDPDLQNENQEFHIQTHKTKSRISDPDSDPDP